MGQNEKCRKRIMFKNLSEIVRKEIKGILGANFDKDFKKYKRSLQEITKNIYDSMKDKYIRNVVAEKIIKNC